MVTWNLKDSNVVVHKLKIKDTLYVPKLDRCMLSSQHVAQELEKEPLTTCASNCTLVMPGFKKIISNDRIANVLTIRSAPGCKHYRTSSTLLERK